MRDDMMNNEAAGKTCKGFFTVSIDDVLMVILHYFFDEVLSLLLYGDERRGDGFSGKCNECCILKLNLYVFF